MMERKRRNEGERWRERKEVGREGHFNDMSNVSGMMGMLSMASRLQYVCWCVCRPGGFCPHLLYIISYVSYDQLYLFLSPSSWDDSSSVSSGISDTFDTDDITSSSVSSYMTTPCVISKDIQVSPIHTQVDQVSRFKQRALSSSNINLAFIIPPKSISYVCILIYRRMAILNSMSVLSYPFYTAGLRSKL